jgi:hypothetical protein
LQPSRSSSGADALISAPTFGDATSAKPRALAVVALCGLVGGLAVFPLQDVGVWALAILAALLAGVADIGGG